MSKNNKNLNSSQSSNSGLPQGMFPPGMDTDALMKMAMSMSQNMSNQQQNGQMDIDGMIDQVTSAVSGMMGNKQIDKGSQDQLKSMTKTVFSTLMADQVSNGQQIESKIDLPEKKELKEPKDHVNYDELSDSEEVDSFNPRTKDMIINLNVSLQELFRGHEKKIAITRKRIKRDPKTNKDKLIEEKKKIVVPIEKGMKDEQVIRYSKQSNELPGYDTGDIVIVLRENGHSYFEREGDNLFVAKNISLYESYASALGLINLTIKTLDNTFLKLESNGIPLHLNDGLRKIVGQGMPIYRKDTRGDLYVRFNLVLPEKFDVAMLNKLKTVFPPLEEDIIYNDGTKDGFDTSGLKVIPSSLENVTEEDLEKLNYEEYSDDEESHSGSSGSYKSESESVD